MVLAFLGGIGWFISHTVTTFGDKRRQELIWQLEFTSKQLEQLYGPLAFVLTEGRQRFDDLLRSLGRSDVFVGDEKLPKEELDTWLFLVEKDFLPRNRRIQELLASRAHLIKGPRLPKSYAEFLKHYSSWEIAHKRWLEQKVEYTWKSSVNWSEQFEIDVLETFTRLRKRHSKILGKLGSVGRYGSRPPSNR